MRLLAILVLILNNIYKINMPRNTLETNQMLQV